MKMNFGSNSTDMNDKIHTFNGQNKAMQIHVQIFVILNVMSRSSDHILRHFYQVKELNIEASVQK